MPPASVTSRKWLDITVAGVVACGMPRPIRSVAITAEQREELKRLIARPTATQREVRRAQIVLARAEGLSLEAPPGRSKDSEPPRHASAELIGPAGLCLILRFTCEPREHAHAVLVCPWRATTRGIAAPRSSECGARDRGRHVEVGGRAARRLTDLPAPSAGRPRSTQLPAAVEPESAAQEERSPVEFGLACR